MNIENKIKKININILIFALFMAIFNIFNAFSLNTATAAERPEYVEGDVLVIFRPEEGTNVRAAALSGIGREALRAASIASENGAWVKDNYPNISEARNGVFTLIHSDILSTDDLINELLARPDVIAASPNYILHTAVMPNDTATPDNNTGLWGLEAINAPDVWSNDITGNKNVYVAIVDTGVDYNHADLAANVDMNLSRNYVSGVSDFMDDNGHGTHIAGTIGAVGNNKYGIVGVNWNVRIIALKVADSAGSASISTVCSALDYLVELVKNNPNMNLAAVNISLEAYISVAPGSMNSSIDGGLWDAMRALDETNRTIMAVAAGNSGITVGSPSEQNIRRAFKGSYVYPASYLGLNNMVSVSALKSDGTLADFSNTNATLAAPGVDILSTFPINVSSSKKSTLSDGATLATISGTSMAAPHVAGAVALLRSYKPSLTASQLKAILVNSGRETLNSASSINGIFNMLDVIEYVDKPENESVIAAAETYPNPSGGNGGSGSGSNNSGGSSGGGCEGFNYGFVALLLLLSFDLKYVKKFVGK